MTDPGYTHYIVIVDRSGSMTRIKADTEGGVRQFAAGQEKVPGRKTLSLYQFDDRFDAVTRFGAAIGVPQAATMDYASSHAGTQSAWSSVSRASAGYASGQSVSVAYSDQDREDALRQDGS